MLIIITYEDLDIKVCRTGGFLVTPIWELSFLLSYQIVISVLLPNCRYQIVSYKIVISMGLPNYRLPNCQLSNWRYQKCSGSSDPFYIGSY